MTLWGWDGPRLMWVELRAQEVRGWLTLGAIATLLLLTGCYNDGGTGSASTAEPVSPTRTASAGGGDEQDPAAPLEAVAAASDWYAALVADETQRAANLQTSDFQGRLSGNALDEQFSCEERKPDNVSCLGFHGGGDGTYATAVEVSLRMEDGRWLVWHATEESAD